MSAALKPNQEPALESRHDKTIENAFATLKALLQKAAERTVDGLWTIIGQLIDLVTPQEIQNLFAAAGYDAW